MDGLTTFKTPTHQYSCLVPINCCYCCISNLFRFDMKMFFWCVLQTHCDNLSYCKPFGTGTLKDVSLLSAVERWKQQFLFIETNMWLTAIIYNKLSDFFTLSSTKIEAYVGRNITPIVIQVSKFIINVFYIKHIKIIHLFQFPIF